MHRGAAIFLAILLVTLGTAPAPAAEQPKAPAAVKAAPPVKAAANRSPVIDNLVLEYTAIERGGSGRIRCLARDADGDPLTYKWEADRGSLSGKGASVVYTAPNSFVDVMVNVYVSDGRGGWAQRSAAFKVVCCGYAQKNPDWKP